VNLVVPTTLRPSWKHVSVWSGLSLLVAALGGFGIVIPRSTSMMVLSLLAAVGFPVACLYYRVEVTDAGITEQRLWRRNHVSWTNIGSFRTDWVPTGPVVGLRYSQAFQDQHPELRLARDPDASHWVFWDSFGLNPEALAKALEEIRRVHGA
jgi:hypothetical protein